jgi:hypothetical protein
VKQEAGHYILESTKIATDAGLLGSGSLGRKKRKAGDAFLKLGGITNVWLTRSLGKHRGSVQNIFDKKAWFMGFVSNPLNMLDYSALI